MATHSRTWGDWDRVRLAGHSVGGAAVSKAGLARRVALEERAALGTLKPKATDSLDVLRDKLARQQAEELLCQFRTDSLHPTCTKPGGVCSIRISREEAGTIEPEEGERGRLRALCPWRFHQDGTAFDKIGESLLSDPAPLRAGKVGFLESTGNLDSDPDEDVGRIDMILLKSNGTDRSSMDWVAVEVQAVSFSGKKMSVEFDHLKLTQGQADYDARGSEQVISQKLIEGCSTDVIVSVGPNMFYTVTLPYTPWFFDKVTCPHKTGPFKIRVCSCNVRSNEGNRRCANHGSPKNRSLGFCRSMRPGRRSRSCAAGHASSKQSGGLFVAQTGMSDATLYKWKAK